MWVVFLPDFHRFLWEVDRSVLRVQIVQALSYLHDLGIAHRDLRSDNLLLNRDGVLKIGGFHVYVG